MMPVHVRGLSAIRGSSDASPDVVEGDCAADGYGAVINPSESVVRARIAGGR